MTSTDNSPRTSSRTSPDTAVQLAATENGHWCDLVSRSHGVPTRIDADMWSGDRRTPDPYPDAVTLKPGLSARDVLSRVDIGSGCVVKDSFHDLDLGGDGFEVTAESEWIYLEPEPTRLDTNSWSPVRVHDRLIEWAAVRGLDTLPFALVEHLDVVILQQRDEHGIVSGAVAHRTGSVVGVSDVFSQSDLTKTWAGLIDAISGRFGGIPIVGHVRDASLEAALSAGFESVGTHRVWTKRS